MEAEPYSPDLAAWVDRAAHLARQANLDHFEVRGGATWDQRHVRRDGRASASTVTRREGVGIRAFSGTGVGYAATSQLDATGIEAAVGRAATLAIANGRRAWKGFPAAPSSSARSSYRPDVRDHPFDVDASHIHRLLERTESGVREVAPESNVQAAFGTRQETNITADARGSWFETVSLLTTLLVAPVVKDGGIVADDVSWRAGERGVGDYEEAGGPEALGREAGRHALEGLRAKPLVAGRHRVMTDPHMTGLLAHESFGHLTEYDLVAPGWSVLKGRLGERLANERVTIRDAPVIDHATRQGIAVPIDHEGQRGRTVTLLDRGVLSDFMHTRDSAAATGAGAAGNARALDYTHPPIVRMRNTYIEPGALSHAEALEQLGTGVYLIGGRGGSPRCDGSFMFTSQRGYLVERGEIVAPIRAAAIQGNVLDFLGQVEAVADDFEVHTSYFGGCGKWDQGLLSVGTGGPHLVVAEALVGGQGA